MEIVEEYEKIRVRSKGFFVLNDREGNLLASGCMGEKFVAKMNEENGEYETKDSEETEQMTLIDWCNINICKYPELKLIYHIPNGGKRGKLEGARLKRGGVKKGVPDLCLPVSRKNYHGLYIEMKFGNGRTSKEQKEWIKDLSEQGYRAVVCNGFDEAKDTIISYMTIG